MTTRQRPGDGPIISAPDGDRYMDRLRRPLRAKNVGNKPQPPARHRLHDSVVALLSSGGGARSHDLVAAKICTLFDIEMWGRASSPALPKVADETFATRTTNEDVREFVWRLYHPYLKHGFNRTHLRQLDSSAAAGVDAYERTGKVIEFLPKNHEKFEKRIDIPDWVASEVRRRDVANRRARLKANKEQAAKSAKAKKKK